jgi:TonB family protein
MFALIESGRAPARRGEWTSRTLSLAIHAALITAGVMATKQVTHAPDPRIFVDPNITWPAPPRPSLTRCGVCDPPVRPPTIPWSFPDPTLTDPTATPIMTLVPGVPTDPGATAPPNPFFLERPQAPGLPLESRAVDEPPEILSHPEPRYPEILRQAGIEGRVVVEAVLDTTGRAEAGSLRIVSASNPLFATEAELVVLRSTYRPGRMAGRAVPVRVLVPIRFGIRR